MPKDGYYIIMENETRHHNSTTLTQILTQLIVDSEVVDSCLTQGHSTYSKYHNGSLDGTVYLEKGNKVWITSATASSTHYILGDAGTSRYTTLTIEYIGNNFTTGN